MTDTTDETLLGSDLAAMCARYGAPIRCEHERGILRLMYEGKDVGTSRGFVEIADGVVVSIAGSFASSRHHDCGSEMVGLPVEVVLPGLGKPMRSVRLGDNTRFEFARWTVTVHEGTIACVVPVGESPKASA